MQTENENVENINVSSQDNDNKNLMRNAKKLAENEFKIISDAS